MLNERRIANREQRANRIMGFTWGELRAFTYTPAVCYFLGTPLLFLAIMSVVGVIVVLTISRRFPPGALADVREHYAEIALHGGRTFCGRRTDVTLRDGDPFLPPRRRHD